MAELDKIQGDIVEIKLSLQRLALTQEGQAKDLNHHIARTDELQDIVERVSKYHASCPARLNHLTHKNLISNIKDVSVVVGLIATLLKLWGII